ncbi:MAG: hypothetical protein H7834_00640 [Magnetococcus sp. YQC-9]
MTTPPLEITLLITRAHLPNGWLQRLQDRVQAPWRMRLFFLHEGVRQLGDPAWTPWLETAIEAAYCAHDHQKMAGPTPLTAIQPGGLATLGRWIQASDLTLSLPAIHWPDPSGDPQSKTVAVLVTGNDPERLQALRLATGLAGCDLDVTLCHSSSTLSIWPTEATPYVQALESLGAHFDSLSITDQTPKTFKVIVQL